MTSKPKSNDDYIESLPFVIRDRIAEARQRDEDEGNNIVLLHDFESALIGTTQNEFGKTVAVYEEGQCIRLLMEQIRKDHPDVLEEDVYSEALDYWSYNTLRTLPYIGESAPIIIQGFDADTPAWDAMAEVG